MLTALRSLLQAARGPAAPAKASVSGREKVPEHLADVAHTQVNDLECVVPGAAEQMQMIEAEAQGGDLALHGDDLCAAGGPEQQGRGWT